MCVCVGGGVNKSYFERVVGGVLRLGDVGEQILSKGRRGGGGEGEMMVNKKAIIIG